MQPVNCGNSLPIQRAEHSIKGSCRSEKSGGECPREPLPQWSLVSPEPTPPSQSLSTNGAESGLDPLERLLKTREGALKSIICTATGSEDCNIGMKPRRGSYNLAYLATLPNGSRWVVRVPDPHHFDSERFEADLTIVRQIADSTTIPVPFAIKWSCTKRNLLGHPFAVMKFLEGVPVSDLWYATTTTDAQRFHLLGDLASNMAQLKRFEYDLLGDLRKQVDSNNLVSCKIKCLEAPEASHFISRATSGTFVQPPKSEPQPVGPFFRASLWHACLIAHAQSKSSDDPWPYVLRLFLPALSDAELDGPPFVLGHPDLDVQNVHLDPATFRVTGILDWDWVSRTRWRATGFAQFPLWITRDWDPLLYGYDEMLRSRSEGGLMSRTASPASAVPTNANGKLGAEAIPGGKDEVYVVDTEQLTVERALADAMNDNIMHEVDDGLPETIRSQTFCSHQVSSVSSWKWPHESIARLEAYRDCYLSAMASIEPSLKLITSRSHICNALETALRSPIPRAGIGFKLSEYVFGRHFYNPFDMPLSIKDGRWFQEAKRKLHQA